MTDIRQTRRSSWQIAQDFLAALFNLFGDPSKIAARHTLAHAQWARLTSWLRAGEALMRMLLAVEAASLPKLAPPPPKKRLPHARTRRWRAFTPEQPDDWRVTFRCFPLDRRRGAGAPTKHTERFHDAWPLAERAEALLRVFNDPLPFAQRLARRLWRQPHRARALTVHPDNMMRLVGPDRFIPLLTAALEAWPIPDSS